MRRQMPKLDFEPVPETPALLPRSLYGESDKELESICEEQEKPEETRESALSAEASSNHNDSPTNRIAMTTSYPDINQKSSEKVTMKVRGELPSTSMAVSPLVTSRYRPRERKLPNKPDLNDAEIAVLDAQMAMAQEATRRSIMGAFIELRAKKAKNEALERTKLSAAHVSDVAVLQNKVEELKMQVAQAEVQREQQVDLLDRFSEFSAKQLHRYQMRWNEVHSLGICFRGWSTAAQQAAVKRNALRRKQIQEQRDRYEHRIVEMAKEYQLKIHQLRLEIDEAKCQVAESQKCRQKLEEDLRLIFLRGVSAMNIEALTAFGSSHKLNHKLGAQEQLIPPSRHHHPSSIQATTPATSTTSSSSKNAVAIQKPAPEISLEATVPAPIANPASSSVPAPITKPELGSVSANSSRVVPCTTRTTREWPRSASSSGLRSAEMIRQHELSLPVGRQSASVYRSHSALSPARKKSISQSSAKYQVEMQYTRSAVAASAARASADTRTRPVLVTRSRRS
ncbi:hypothetical protein PR003_g15398 [Phytophthora rubi]|uniref:Centrosomal protein POC5 n=1 Tax=Phytophthora rubi TaxID=129364 RepID=A0A6A4F0G4_9STRA|nr:hypothetical protein PR002_g14898 [Phytophthora rubi]KAE9330116.1 hypothetical protein PR003_g15398 [Phytophthora rubi]